MLSPGLIVAWYFSCGIILIHDKPAEICWSDISFLFSLFVVVVVCDSEHCVRDTFNEFCHTCAINILPDLHYVIESWKDRYHQIRQTVFALVSCRVLQNLFSPFAWSQVICRTTLVLKSFHISLDIIILVQINPFFVTNISNKTISNVKL